jgi:hypothetical protein
VWLVTATVALAACTSPQTGEDAVSTSTSTIAESTTVAVGRSDFPASGPVEPGTYQIPPSAWNVAGVTMTMPEGWETQFGPPTAFKFSGGDTELALYFVTVDEIYSDPCQGEGELIEIGPTVDDLANALLDQPHTVATGPVDTTFGGLPAKKIDMTVPADLDPATCRMGEHLQIWYSEPPDKYFVLLGDATAHVYIFDVNGERQVFYTHYQAGATAEDISELQSIIDSFKIDS